MSSTFKFAVNLDLTEMARHRRVGRWRLGVTCLIGSITAASIFVEAVTAQDRVPSTGQQTRRSGLAEARDAEQADSVATSGEQTLVAAARQAGQYDLVLGESVVKTRCIACHGSDISGAPQLADGESWRYRLGQGFNALVSHAVHGHGDMPPKGGFSELTDDEVTAAVAYIVNESQRFFANDAAATQTCDSAERAEGCTPEQLRNLLVLELLWLLSGQRQ